VLPLLGALTGILPRTLFAHGVNAVAFLVVSLALAVWGRETLLRTQLNRSVLGAVILTPFSQLMMALGCAQLGINAEQAATLHQFLWFVICAGLALSIDWRIGIAALGYLIGFFCSAHWPGVHPLSSSLGNLVMTIVAAVMWLPMRASREGPGDPAT